MYHYPLAVLQGDAAQVQHAEAEKFGTGRLVARDLILTAAHVVLAWPTDKKPVIKDWWVRLARDKPSSSAEKWLFRRHNRVVWWNLEKDLALIRIVHPRDSRVPSLEPRLRLHIGFVDTNASPGVEARGYPLASKKSEDTYCALTPAQGRLFGAETEEPLVLGVDTCDIPTNPEFGWPGFSGSAVTHRDTPDLGSVWVYGVVKAVPAEYLERLTVARLADAWGDRWFRRLLRAGGVTDDVLGNPPFEVPIIGMPNQSAAPLMQDATALRALVTAVAAGRGASLAPPASVQKKIAEIAKLHGLSQREMTGVIVVLHERGVPTDELSVKLAEVASQLGKTIYTLHGLDGVESPDIEVRSAIERAEAAVAGGRLEEAQSALVEAAAFDFAEAARQAKTDPDVAMRLRSAASSYRAAGELSLSQLDYAQAASLFSQAHEQLPERDVWERRRLKERYAAARFLEGEHGDKLAIVEAIDETTKLIADLPEEADQTEKARLYGTLAVFQRRLGERESGSQRLHQAVVSVKVALDICTPERDARARGWLQANLADALQDIGDREKDTKCLVRAVKAYDEALTAFSLAAYPLEWARIGGLRASTFRALGERSPSDARLRAAKASFDEALQVLTPQKAPLAHAWLQDGLGTTLRALGERAFEPDWLGPAEQAFRMALTIRKRETVPLDWAASLGGLGIVLMVRGERGVDPRPLLGAAACFRLALQERTRERDGPGWGWMQGWLGRSYQALGHRRGSTRLLQRAVKAYASALEERTRQKFPLDFAWLKGRMGSTLELIGGESAGLRHLEHAIAALQEALELVSPEQAPLSRAWIQDALGSALYKVGERTQDATILDGAITQFEAALEVRDRKHLPIDWAASSAGLGQTWLALGKLGDDRRALTRAAFHLEGANEVFSPIPGSFFKQRIETALDEAWSLCTAATRATKRGGGPGAGGADAPQ